MSWWSPRAVLTRRAMRRHMSGRVFDQLESEMKATFADETSAMRRRAYDYLIGCQARETRVANVISGIAGTSPDRVTFDDGVEMRLIPGGNAAVQAMAAFLVSNDQPVLLRVATGGAGAYRFAFGAGGIDWALTVCRVDICHAV